jgi:hypothetical protein
MCQVNVFILPKDEIFIGTSESSWLILLAQLKFMTGTDLWNESLKSDGQQFHQYQQKQQPPLTLTHWRNKYHMTFQTIVREKDYCKIQVILNLWLIKFSVSESFETYRFLTKYL